MLPHYYNDWLREDGTLAAVHTDILTRDLAWWTNDSRLAALYERSENNARAIKIAGPLQYGLTIGFHGVEHPARSHSHKVADVKADSPAATGSERHIQPGQVNPFDQGGTSAQVQLSSSAELLCGGETVSLDLSCPISYAFCLHIFAGFMWSVSAEIQPNSLEQDNYIKDSELFDVEDLEKTWALPTIRNKRIMRLVRVIGGFGLATVRDVFLTMIPPLSHRRLLPNMNIMETLLNKAKEYEEKRPWEQIGPAYLNLLSLDLDPRQNDRLAFEIIVDVKRTSSNIYHVRT
jgi:hypothetical protein